MINRITSGGQTGAEQAAWRAAAAFGVATGGWMPAGFQTGAGARPELTHEYGAAELPTDDERTRIDQNVQDADATLWFGETTTAAAQRTVRSCLRLGKPYLPVYPAAAFEPAQVAKWVTDNQVMTLNVAGNSEAEEPGIGARVEHFVGEVLRLLGHPRG
jgi:Circularly permutated YpsA SLOG family